MPSTVGLQSTESAVIEQAVALEFDCVTAYSQAAKSAHNLATANTFSHLADDCVHHIEDWQRQLSRMNQPPAGRNAITAPLNRIKVQVASVFGDRVIALAVRNNSADSAEAYARVSADARWSEDTRNLASHMLADAEAHRAAVAEILHPNTSRTAQVR